MHLLIKEMKIEKEGFLIHLCKKELITNAK